MKLVVATRSRHKAGEIAEMLRKHPEVEVVDLDAAGIPETAEEEGIEAFETFEENALAKARCFAARTGHPVLADDSGICVDALDGGPGVYSKRFSGADLTGEALDRQNNLTLLEQLSGIQDETRRGAHYVCVMALVAEGEERLFRGTVHGRILEAPRGEGGFGYDPLFFLPALDATFGEVGARQKNLISHRSAALREAVPAIVRLARTGSLPAES